MRKLLVTVLTALFATPILLAGDGAGKFLRFEMIEYKTDGEPTEIRVRIPLSMIAAFRGPIDEALAEIDFDGHEIDFRDVWEKVRETGDNEYADIRQDDAEIKVATEGEYVIVKVHQKKGGQKITAKIPMALGDLLFGSRASTEELIEALADFDGEDLFTMEGDNMEMRAWIDDGSEQ